MVNHPFNPPDVGAGWHRITLYATDQPSACGKNGYIKRDVIDWLANSVGPVLGDRTLVRQIYGVDWAYYGTASADADYQVTRHEFWFRDKTRAMLFKLRWGGSHVEGR